MRVRSARAGTDDAALAESCRAGAGTGTTGTRESIGSSGPSDPLLAAACLPAGAVVTWRHGRKLWGRRQGRPCTVSLTMIAAFALLLAACQGNAGEIGRSAIPGDPRTRAAQASEEACVDRWLADRGLDRYGSPPGTMYTGGSPLFDESTGVTMCRLEYVYARHPDALQACAPRRRSRDRPRRRTRTRPPVRHADRIVVRSVRSGGPVAAPKRRGGVGAVQLRRFRSLVVTLPGPSRCRQLLAPDGA